MGQPMFNLQPLPTGGSVKEDTSGWRETEAKEGVGVLERPLDGLLQAPLDVV